jgi:hypothetical protein
MNKKSGILLSIILIIGAVSFIAYKTFGVLDKFDFDDPFETEFEDF